MKIESDSDSIIKLRLELQSLKLLMWGDKIFHPLHTKILVLFLFQYFPSFIFHLHFSRSQKRGVKAHDFLELSTLVSFVWILFFFSLSRSNKKIQIQKEVREKMKIFQRRRSFDGNWRKEIKGKFRMNLFVFEKGGRERAESPY